MTFTKWSDFYCRGLTNLHLNKFLAPAFQVNDDSSVTFTSIRNSLQMSMIQNSFSSWSVEASAWVTLPFIFHVSIVIRLLQFWGLPWIFWRCEDQWRSNIRGSHEGSHGNNDGRCQFIVQCKFTMHRLDIYDLTASFNTVPACESLSRWRWPWSVGRLQRIPPHRRPRIRWCREVL